MAFEQSRTRSRILSGKWALALAAGLVAVVAAPSVLYGQSAPAGASSLPAGAGRDVVEQTCSNCHAIGMVVSKRRSAEEWNDVLNKMVSYGAVLSNQQMSAAHGYLSANFGPTGATAATALPAAPATPAVAKYPRPSGANQWPAYGGGGANTNFSPLTQITPANVSKLKQAWVYHFGAGTSNQGDEGIDFRFEITPLIIGGVMYISTPAPPRGQALGVKASVTALKPETGQVLWKYESPYNIHGRGLAYWPGDATTAPRVFFGTDQGYIMAVDVTTGQLAAGFGRNGAIDAYVGVASEIVGESRRNSFTIPNPVTVYKNLIIAGARPEESGPPAPRGDIRAFDAKTGRLAWTFHTVPQPGEPGHETYKGDEWRDTSGANVWSTMSLDEANGIVYAPTGDLNSDAGGPHLYSASLLALDAATGKLRWYKQIVHRDMWDWDSPTPPVLFDYTGKDGRTVPAVLVTGKQGLVFLFNRLTGDSINGFDETPTPRLGAGQIGEIWPTQPMPRWPGNVARVQMTRDEIPNLVPGMKEACTKFWDDNQIVSVPLYGPRQNTEFNQISYPSSTGGPNWGGGAYNPDLGLYFINVQNRPTYRAKVPAGSGEGGMNRAPRPEPSGPPQPRLAGGPRPPQPFTFSTPDGVNLTCGATPWGELVAVDIKREKIAWRVPLGSTLALGAAGANTGAPNLGGSLATKSGLVFIGAANDRRLRAFEAKTGKKLWEAEMPASGHATPITFVGANRKQYVVIAAGGGTSAGGREMSDTLIAYTLP